MQKAGIIRAWMIAIPMMLVDEDVVIVMLRNPNVLRLGKIPSMNVCSG